MNDDFFARCRIAPRAVILAFAVVLAGAPGVLFAQSKSAPMHSAAGITYITGGIGKESQQQMKSEAGKYNLQMTFVTGKAYVSDAQVTITDSAGKTVLDTPVDGPKLFAKLDAGSYTVKSVLSGVTRTQKISIAKSEVKTLTVSFPASAAG